MVWISTDTANPYTSRNIGIEASKGGVIGFLDAKCIPSAKWIDQAMTSLTSDERTIIAGRYDVIANSEALKDQAYGLLYLNNHKNVTKGYGVTTGNLWAPKSAFLDLGYFADQFVSGNDILWTKNAIKKGYKIMYAEHAIVVYEGQSYEKLKGSIEKYFTGIAIQHKNNKKGLFSRLAYLAKQFMPMRFSNFQESIDYRGLNKRSWLDKTYLWFIIWRLKIHMAFTYLRRMIGL